MYVFFVIKIIYCIRILAVISRPICMTGIRD